MAKPQPVLTFRKPRKETPELSPEAADAFVHGSRRRAQPRKPCTLHLSPEVARQLRIAAATHGREMSEIAEAAILAYLPIMDLTGE